MWYNTFIDCLLDFFRLGFE